MKVKNESETNSPANINLEETFPLSSQVGAPTTQINNFLMKEITIRHPELTETEFDEILKEHIKYLNSIEEKGKWDTLLVGQIVQGFCVGHKFTEGKQADFSHNKLNWLNLSNKNLSNSNFLCSIAENVDASVSNFENCLFTDSYWQNSNFESSCFVNTDFSRADLRNCNFKYTDLQGADFENCNLENADFTGANLLNSRFPGANLKNVKY